MYISSVLLATSLLAASIYAQETTAVDGYPAIVEPSDTLTPEQSTVVNKYAADVNSALGALATTTPLAYALGSFYATATTVPEDFLPTAGPQPPAALAAELAILKGTTTANPYLSLLPSDLEASVLAAQATVAAIAHEDLTAEPDLASVAPYYIIGAQEGAAAGASSNADATPTASSLITSYASPSASQGSGSGSGSGNALPFSSVSISGSSGGKGSASKSGSVAGGASATSSPIASAKAAGSGAGKTSGSLTSTVGMLVGVAVGVVVLL